MGLSGIVNRFQNKGLNIAIVILAILISNSVYQQQQAKIKLLEERKVEELQKNEALKSIGQSEVEIAAYKKALPESDSSILINVISTTAKESGVKIDSIRPMLEEERTLDYTKYPFDVVVSADDYHALGRFMSKIESYRDARYLVERVNLDTEQEQGELSINITLSNIAFKE